MYIMFIVHSWPAFCHAANKRRLIDYAHGCVCWTNNCFVYKVHRNQAPKYPTSAIKSALSL